MTDCLCASTVQQSIDWSLMVIAVGQMSRWARYPRFVDGCRGSMGVFLRQEGPRSFCVYRVGYSGMSWELLGSYATKAQGREGLAFQRQRLGLVG